MAYLALHPVEFTLFTTAILLSQNPYLVSVALFLRRRSDGAGVTRYGILWCPDFPPNGFITSRPRVADGVPN